MPSIGQGVPTNARSTISAGQADDFEDLCSAVARDVRDPHLGHHLEDAVLDGLPEPRLCLFGRRAIATDLVPSGHLGECLEREARADRLRSVAEEAREVVNLPGLVRLDDERRLRSQPRGDQPVVDDARREERGHGHSLGGRVGDQEHPRAGANRGLRLVAEAAAGPLESLLRCEGRVEPDGRDLVECVREEEEALELDAGGDLGPGRQERRPAAENGAQRHDEALAQVVDRRVGDLGEALLEVVIERTRPSRERRQRRVVAHRVGGVVRVGRDRAEEHHELLARVAEGRLAGGQAPRRGARAASPSTRRRVLRRARRRRDARPRAAP